MNNKIHESKIQVRVFFVAIFAFREEESWQRLKIGKTRTLSRLCNKQRILEQKLSQKLCPNNIYDSKSFIQMFERYISIASFIVKGRENISEQLMESFRTFLLISCSVMMKIKIEVNIKSTSIVSQYDSSPFVIHLKFTTPASFMINSFWTWKRSYNTYHKNNISRPFFSFKVLLISPIISTNYCFSFIFSWQLYKIVNTT